MLSRSGWGSNTGAKALDRGSSRFASSNPVTTPLRTRFSLAAALQPPCVGPQCKRPQGRGAVSCHTPGARNAHNARANGPQCSSGTLLEAHLQSRCLAWPPSAGLAQRTLTAAAAGITVGGGSHEPSHAHATQPASRTLGSMLRGAGKQYTKFMKLTGKFMPMVVLFFLLAFVNTILDSLKDTLVITAAGGGAQVIPYLTVYAVLPSSLVFLLLYSLASQRMSRAALFSTIVLTFMTFFAIFAYVLYPNHHLIHPHGAADSLALLLPLGVEGLVGMIRNWTFTLFFCMSELWGDVCLGLLFWGLANDTTTLADAPTLYPLFGLGANLAQALAGWVLKVFGSMSQAAALAREEAAVAAGRGLTLAESGFSYEIQSLMMVVMGFALAALSMHSFIDRQHALSKAAATRRGEARQRLKVDAEEVEDRGKGLAGSSSSSSSSNSGEGAGGSKKGGEKAKPSVLTIFRVLAASVPIRCLAIMSLAQGLCTSLMEFAWKSHISLLYPTPAQFTSFLGDVSVWQGVVTGGLMVLSPALFERLGWKGVASTTPIILMWGGSLFFAACMAFQFFLAGSPQVGLGHLTLQVLVYLGALLYVFSKSAKFSLFKPAEEMVYISLDEEGRTKGKAAIDVVGSQAGKSGGSILQQVLLLASAGQIAGILPILFCFFFAMSKGWLRSVAVLSNHDNYGHPDTVHASIQSMGSPERSPEPSPSPARSAAAAAGKAIQQPLPAPQHLPPAAMSGQTMTEAFGAAGAGAAMATAGGVTSNGTHALADVSGNGIEQRSKAVPAAAAAAGAAAATAAAAASDATAASAAAAASRS